jgi:glycosyltransferase involved in cell wall biosynthesis
MSSERLKPFRLAHVMAGAPHGGAEAFFERIIAAQAGAGDEILAVIKRNPDRRARLENHAAAIAELRFGAFADWTTRRRLGRLLRAFRPDVVMSWMSRASEHTPRGPYVLVGRLGGFYNLRHFRHCDHLVANSQSLLAWLRAQGWEASRTHYLPNFVRDHGGAAPAADLAGAGRLILALGRLHEEKGFDILLRAFARLAARGEGEGVRLLIAGEGPERSALIRLAGELGIAGRVIFAGWREDVAALLAASAFLVCPSRVEPLGNVIPEAWSAGRAVVASRVSGPAELIREGEDGLLVPPEDPEALAGALAALLADPALAARLGAAGRARFLAEFTEGAVLGEWRRFFAKMRALREERDRRAGRERREE